MVLGSAPGMGHPVSSSGPPPSLLGVGLTTLTYKAAVFTPTLLIMCISELFVAVKE